MTEYHFVAQANPAVTIFMSQSHKHRLRGIPQHTQLCPTFLKNNVMLVRAVWIKVLLAKPDNPISILKSHMVK